MFEAVRDKVIKKMVVNAKDLPDIDEEAAIEEHNMGRDLKMISFCNEIR
jgi:hypothetical protein